MAKLSTYLTNTSGATVGNLTDPVAMQQYNQAQSALGIPTGQYCVQITIERTVENSFAQRIAMDSFLDIGICQ